MEPDSKAVLSAVETRIGKYGLAVKLYRSDGDSAKKMDSAQGSGVTSSHSVRWERYVQKRMEFLASRRALVVVGSLVVLIEAAYLQFIVGESRDGKEGCSGISRQVYEQRSGDDIRGG